jgi:hypothetical protein
MSHGHPTGASTLFPSYTALYGGRWRVERRIDVRNQAQIVDALFPAFAAEDIAKTTAATIGFADLRLVAKSLDQARGNPDGILNLVYETLTQTLVDEQAPKTTTGDDGRNVILRQVVGLLSAPTTALEIGSLYATVYVVDSVVNNSTEYAAKFAVKCVEAGASRALVGDTRLITDEDGQATVEANWIQLASATYVPLTVGTDAAPGMATALFSHEIAETNQAVRRIRSFYKVATTTLTELGASELGVKFEVGVQTAGDSDRVITRKYTILASAAASKLVRLMPPALTDPVFTNAYIVDQAIHPSSKSVATVTRVFAEVPTAYSDWDDTVIQLPGVEKGAFQLDDFPFRSAPTSEAMAVRIDRKFFLSNPVRIPKIAEFRPVDAEGNRVNVLTDDTTPSSSEYLSYVNGGTYLCDRCSVHRWKGDIWERRTVWFKAQ